MTIDRPWSRSPRKTREELVLLVRGEDGGRFVENEQPGVAVEQLEDLNALLHANRQVLHLRIRIDGQMMLVAQAAQPSCRLAQIEAFQAEHGVLDHRKSSHQHEFLVHHADAQRDGILWTTDLDRLVIDQNRAGIHGMKSVQNLHQGALAGAVLAQQSMNFSRLDGEVDIAIGHHAGETLDDLSHCERRQSRLLYRNDIFCSRWRFSIYAINAGMSIRFADRSLHTFRNAVHA